MPYLFLQEMVDTTSYGYRLGYKIGTWLPVIVLITLYLLMLYASFRRKRKKQP